MSSLMHVLGIKVKKPKIAGFSVQSSVYGLPIPIVYGWARIAANLIHMPKQPVPVKSGGKGSGKGSGKSGGQDYVAPIALGLCEGPIGGIGWVWHDKDQKVDFATYYATNGWSLFTGTSSQSPWSYLSSNYPAEAVPYQFTAYVANPAVTMPNAQLSQYAWEVQGFLPFGGGILDANPAAIISDYLTNAQYGANFPSSLLASMTPMTDYCAAAGLFASPVFSSQVPARDQLNELLEISNTAAVWSDGALKFVPYGDTALSGNGHTFTPNTTPLYNLGDGDFMRNSASDLAATSGDQAHDGDLDPILVARTDPAKAYNQIPVEYEDRNYDYNTSTYTYTAQAAAIAYGPLPLSTLQLHSIKSSAVAQQVATIRGQREQSVRNTYTFIIGWKYSLLEPMDLVTLTDAGLGLSQTPVRIVSVTELDSEQGFEVVAEDWPLGTATAALYTTGSASGSMPATNVDPGNTSTPVIFEAPTPLAKSPLDIMIGATGGANWGGCDVWISTDNTTFTKVGTIVGKAAYGTTTASLATNAAWPSTDSTHTLAVDISASGRTLSTFSAADFAALTPLCLVDQEFVAYETATLTGTGLYNLTTLYRGLYNSTIPASHSGGVRFVFIDDAIARIPFPQGTAGQTVYFKFPAFNVYGGATQDLSSISSVSYTIGSNPVPFQSGIPQGTGAVDANGSWSATADLPPSYTSAKYLTSTSAYPSDSSTISTGTVVNGRTFSVVAGGTLTFGQTLYMTVVPYTAAGANGITGPSIHIRVAYQNYTNTITAHYSVGSYRPLSNFNFNAGSTQLNVVGAVTNTNYGFESLVTIPVGAVVTNVAHEVYLHTTTGAHSVAFIMGRIFGPGGYAIIGSGVTTSALDWQTLADTPNITNTGEQYFVQGILGFAGVTPVDADAALGGFYVTYTTTDPLINF